MKYSTAALLLDSIASYLETLGNRAYQPEYKKIDIDKAFGENTIYDNVSIERIGNGVYTLGTVKKEVHDNYMKILLDIVITNLIDDLPVLEMKIKEEDLIWIRFMDKNSLEKGIQRFREFSKHIAIDVYEQTLRIAIILGKITKDETARYTFKNQNINLYTQVIYFDSDEAYRYRDANSKNWQIYDRRLEKKLKGYTDTETIVKNKLREKYNAIRSFLMIHTNVILEYWDKDRTLENYLKNNEEERLE